MNLEELEATFKEIDTLSESGNVKIGLSGTAEDSGTIRVDLNTKEIGVSELSSVEVMNKSLPTDSTETILEVDLAGVNVPDEYIREKINFAINNATEIGIPDVVIREVDPSGIYELMEDYTYQANGNYKIEAKKGYKFDRASIPRIFWVIISKDDLSNVAPLFHDMIYEYKGVLPDGQVIEYREFTKSDADNLFYEIMRKRKVKKWRAYLAYLAVKKFGQSAWNN